MFDLKWNYFDSIIMNRFLDQLTSMSKGIKYPAWQKGPSGQIGFPIHFISVAHCYPLVLINDTTQMWQYACHI